MKYYSTVTSKVYDSVEDLNKAEEEFNAAQKAKEAKETERKERAKEVENAYKAARDAQAEADKKLKSFVKDYGSFHTTIKNEFPRTSLIDFMLSTF